MDVGRDPKSATVWARPTLAGVDEWHIPSSGDEAFEHFGSTAELIDDLISDIRSALWSEASRHDNGEGLAGGGDFYHIMRGLKRHQASSQYDEH
eukprot:7265664-Pyramimonas_sp.AAC.1